MLSDNLRERYETAWAEKLAEIRKRPHSEPMVPYEAHDYALAAVAADAWDEGAMRVAHSTLDEAEWPSEVWLEENPYREGGGQ